MDFVGLKAACTFFFVSVKEKLAQDPDNEIATTSLRISLLCPVRFTLVEMEKEVNGELFTWESRVLLKIFTKQSLPLVCLSVPTCCV